MRIGDILFVVEKFFFYSRSFIGQRVYAKISENLQDVFSMGTLLKEGSFESFLSVIRRKLHVYLSFGF